MEVTCSAWSRSRCVPFAAVYAKYVRRLSATARSVGRLNALLNDNLSGIREIKAFTREAEKQRVHAGIEKLSQSQLSAL